MKKYATIRNYAKLHHKQVGMTLIELTVVLLILIGLAGLLIPYVGSFVQKTHDSTNSSNMAQLNNAFIRYTVENNRLPQHMDSLTNSDTVAANAGTGVCATAQTVGQPYCGLLDSSVFATVAYTRGTNGEPATSTTTAEIGFQSLEKANISMAVANDPTAKNKTFGSSSGMIMLNYMAMGAYNGLKVAPLGATRAAALGVANTVNDHMALALGKDPMDYKPTCYDYVAFGLGDANGLVSKTIASAPVHYPEDATMGPVDYYNHYIAIVQVDISNGSGCSSVTEPAKFLGTVMNIPNHTGKGYLYGVNASLGYAYENQLAGK